MSKEIEREIMDYLFWYSREISNGGIPTLSGKIYVDHVQTLLSSLEKEKERFPCKHRKADWDNGYGDCAICQTKFFNDELEEELEREKVRADRAEHNHEVALALRDAMREKADKAEKRLEAERISVNKLSLANQELEERMKELEQVLDDAIHYNQKAEKRLGAERVSVNELSLANQELEKRVGLAESELSAIKFTLVYRLGGMVEGRPTIAINYLQRIDELRRIEERVKELEATLASIKSDSSIGKLVVEDSFGEDDG